MSYSYQNLMGPKRLKTTHMTLQYINSGLSDLNRNYGLIYKIRQNWRKLVGTQFKFKGCKFCICIERLMHLYWFFCMNNCLVDWYYSRENKFDPLYCRIFGRSLWNLWILMLWEIYDINSYTIMNILHPSMFNSKCTRMHTNYEASV